MRTLGTLVSEQMQVSPAHSGIGHPAPATNINGPAAAATNHYDTHLVSDTEVQCMSGLLPPGRARQELQPPIPATLTNLSDCNRSSEDNLWTDSMQRNEYLFPLRAKRGHIRRLRPHVDPAPPPSRAPSVIEARLQVYSHRPPHGFSCSGIRRVDRGRSRSPRRQPIHWDGSTFSYDTPEDSVPLQHNGLPEVLFTPRNETHWTVPCSGGRIGLHELRELGNLSCATGTWAPIQFRDRYARGTMTYNEQAQGSESDRSFIPLANSGFAEINVFKSRNFAELAYKISMLPTTHLEKARRFWYGYPPGKSNRTLPR